MLKGDNKEVAEDISKTLKREGYFAEVLTDEQRDKVRKLQNKEEMGTMTDDGVKILRHWPRQILALLWVPALTLLRKQLISSSRKVFRRILKILFFLAAWVLYSWSIMISPALGAVLMSLNTMIVAINAQLLRKNMKEPG